MGWDTGAVYTFPTMAELLQNTHVSWKYYDEKPNPRQHSLWNPLPGFRQFQQRPELMSHLVGVNQFYKDAKSGHLPQVCWIVPTAIDSEHPPADSARGMRHVTHLVNAIMRSNAWKELCDHYYVGRLRRFLRPCPAAIGRSIRLRPTRSGLGDLAFCATGIYLSHKVRLHLPAQTDRATIRFKTTGIPR